MDQKEEIEALKAELKEAREINAAYSRRLETIDAMWLELGFILGLNELAYPMDVYGIRQKVADLVGKRDVLDTLEDKCYRYVNLNEYPAGSLPLFTRDKIDI
jgi:hypothetical protein